MTTQDNIQNNTNTTQQKDNKSNTTQQTKDNKNTKQVKNNNNKNNNAKPTQNTNNNKEEQPVIKINVSGVFEQCGQEFGFLRIKNYENSLSDIYVSPTTIKKYNLLTGDFIQGVAKKQATGSPSLQEVLTINDIKFDPSVMPRKLFDSFTPYYPIEKIKLLNQRNMNDVSLRCLDLFIPLGFGQRGLIVSPPKAGKTTLLKKIAQAIEDNYKDVKLIVLLIDERPEEVTDIQRSISSEVVYSTFDKDPLHHIKISELVINRAMRLVENGLNVVILLDSITRLARAYNNSIESSGKILTGGIDPIAMQGAKKIFGKARNIENGGSLSIIATALINTGSKMDDIIYEEFKGTGNMEIFLSRNLSEKRIFPSIDIYKSGTRKEELLLTEKELQTTNKIRNIFDTADVATSNIIDMLTRTKDNDDLCNKLNIWLKYYESENQK